MNKIDLSMHYKELDGSESKDDSTKLSALLSNLLAKSGTGDFIKLTDHALTIYRNGKLECDDQDLKAIQAAVKETKIYNNMVKRQIHDALEKIGSKK